MDKNTQNREEEKSTTETAPENQDLEELKDLLLRTQANFENYRKQTQKRMEEIRETAARETVLAILPLFDNLELALKHGETSSPDDFVKGVTLIVSQFNVFLEQNEITTMVTTNEKFDPFLHEAIVKVPSEKPENTILEEYQRGFLFKGKVLRHAKVKVSAGGSAAQERKENLDERKKTSDTIRPY